ncbi:bleomycin resistance protein [Psychroserpens sp. Hel_I_66]|uniref:bleomycin resistance protein n=1 Tax=Psychroserpens sp. Hel_I_66 TaxID=1250004 RepID=UPI0006456C99|nr:VOC family protein [Psychroserpens sp. Hel_I_66]
MLKSIIPKLPMRNKATTKAYYHNLGFKQLGETDYDGYLMIKKDDIEIHFFEFKDLDPNQNYGQVYIRTNDVEGMYDYCKKNTVKIHPNGPLEIKPWGTKEFALMDPDSNLLTFGQIV